MVWQSLKRVSPGVLLFLWFFALYVLTMSGTIRYGDEIEKYRVAQSIVERGEFSFRPTAQRNVIGAGGRTVSGYELGQTLIQVPFYALGKLAYTVVPVPDSNLLTMLFVGLVNPLVSALVIVLFFVTARRLGFSHQIALGLAVALGLATIVFPYSRSFTREPLLTFFLLLSFYTALRFSQTLSKRWLLFTGLATGYLAFTKFIQGVVMPVFLVYAVGVMIQNGRQRRATSAQIIGAALRGTLIFLLPGLVLLALQSAYAFVRFGTLTSGLGGLAENPLVVIWQILPLAKPLDAFAGLLFSLDKSVFVYSPPLVLGLIGWWWGWRAQKRATLLLIALTLVEFFPLLLRYDWDGGTWWGPRYLVQITPLMLLPIGFWLIAQPKLARRVFTIFCALGIGVQLVGAVVSDRVYLDVMGVGATLAGQIDFVRNGALDLWWFAGLPAQINPMAILLVTVELMVGALLAMQWRREETNAPVLRDSWIFLAAMLALMAMSFAAFVVAPYAQIARAKGDAYVAAAKHFLAENKTCQAAGMYAVALQQDTQFAHSAAQQLAIINPRVAGKSIELGNPAFWVESENDAGFANDETTTITGNGALKFFAPSERDASIILTSEPIGVKPGARYELSAWLKSLTIYGSGTGTLGVYEDNGDWGNRRDTVIASIDETNGWQLVRKTLTTLPTTRRVFIKMGLSKTFGTFWVDGVELVQIDSAAAQPARSLPPCQIEK